ncbi:MAG: hypothetical protein HFF01_02235 [Erysipelotrichaceae bacterium]|nr:hypothetical protein [Erysipelotrichaceae bacterium]MCI9523857.1 hypothetical protein [Erysipelotrichaceae bacterium]
MAKKKKSQLSSEGKTELAKAIAEKSQTFARTYANMETSVTRFFRWLSSWIDRLLFNQKHGKMVALILAILFCIMLDSDDNFDLFKANREVKTLNNLSVSTIVSEQAYEVSGIPETVTVEVIGESSDLQMLNLQDNYQIVADLSGLTEGAHDVTLQAKNFSPRLEVIIKPSTAVVTIKRKESKRFTLGYDFVNTAKMDSIYALGEPQFDQGEVVVRASTETLSKIAFVKALIDVSGVESDFESEAEIAAYDQAGNRIKVDIRPSTVKASVKVSTPNKSVPITLVPNGTMPNGKAIASYKLDSQAVTIYAPESVLETITELPIYIPVHNLTSDQRITMPINLPSKVTKASLNNVAIEIKIENAETKEIKDVPIQYKNAPSTGYDVKAVDGNSGTMVVTVNGAKGQLEGVTKNDIQIVADFSAVTEPGVYDIPISITGTNKLLTYETKSTTIKLEFRKKE